MKTPITFAEKKDAITLHNAAGLKVLERIIQDLETAASLFNDSVKFSQETGQYSQQFRDAEIACQSAKTKLREVKERHEKSEAAKQQAADQQRMYGAMAARAKFSSTDREL